MRNKKHKKTKMKVAELQMKISTNPEYNKDDYVPV